MADWCWFLKNVRFHPEEEKNEKVSRAKWPPCATGVSSADALVSAAPRARRVVGITEIVQQARWDCDGEGASLYSKSDQQIPRARSLQIIGGAKVSDFKIKGSKPVKIARMLIEWGMAYTF